MRLEALRARIQGALDRPVFWKAYMMGLFDGALVFGVAVWWAR